MNIEIDIELIFSPPDSREPQTKGESNEWLHRFRGSNLKFPTSEGENHTLSHT